MPNIRLIRRRIRSVQNTAKITQAMELIAASKMRRAQQRALAARPYAEKMLEVLGYLAEQPREVEELHPLLQKREPKRLEVLHITPDRGLTGGLTGNLNRRAAQFIFEEKLPASIVTVGKKGRDFMIRHGQDVRAVFTDLGDRVGLADVLTIARIVMDDYTSGFVDRVYLVYADFISTMVQRPSVLQILPVEAKAIQPGSQEERPGGRQPAAEEAAAAQRDGVGYIYEPDGLTVLSQLLPRFVEMQVYHAVLEAIASEQSARMVAMRSATDNAKEMITNLTLELNKARQESITSELLDITGGVVALEG